MDNAARASVNIQRTNMYRHTWAEVDLDAIQKNVHSFQQILPSKTNIMAVVKANGYGHGAVPVARTALTAGATWLGVALMEEAIELREAGISAPILILGYVSPQTIPVAQEYRVSVAVMDVEFLEQAREYIQPQLPACHFHLKLDTGMSRLGIQCDAEFYQFVDAYTSLSRSAIGEHLVWEGVYTHFATADEAEPSYFHTQVQRFERRLAHIEQVGIHVPVVHMANSAAIIRHPRCSYVNLVRLGISMYGLHPSENMAVDFPFLLHPAFSLHSKFGMVKQIPAGTGVSYGCTYRTRTDEWIGVLPIGYGDGWPRQLSNQTDVLVDGKRFPVVGRICMDQTMVRLDRAYSRGEQVTLIGQQKSEFIHADEIARTLGTINYEIPCMINPRIPRIYITKRHNSSIKEKAIYDE